MVENLESHTKKKSKEWLLCRWTTHFSLQSYSQENGTDKFGKGDLLSTSRNPEVTTLTNEFVENQLLTKLKHIRTKNYKIQYCPDIHFQCLNNQTCCKLPDLMGYGCCPIANAVCCIDGQYLLINLVLCQWIYIDKNQLKSHCITIYLSLEISY